MQLVEQPFPFVEDIRRADTNMIERRSTKVAVASFKHTSYLPDQGHAHESPILTFRICGSRNDLHL
ncbi:hypothetical protein, partial [Sphingorhabdus sp.]|uniref:hypothetical protein n=1 Tax=Sphingorhabdus sp. TaxID=1902408 RepID=UPI003C728EB5